MWKNKTRGDFISLPITEERKMKKKMYAIRDTKAEIYKQPTYFLTHGEAERAFKELANDREGIIGKNPEDFDLYYMGEFDDETGNIIPQEAPQHIQKAIHLKQQHS